MTDVNCVLTRKEVEIICQALTHLHQSNVGYLGWKKDKFSQEQIPIYLKKIDEVYDKMHRLRTK